MANKKTFPSPSPAVQIHPRPQPAAPPPYPEPTSEPTEIYYPSTDGKPMADNSWQARTMTGKYDMLSARYEPDPNTFVGIDMLLYYTKDKAEDVVAPDVFVVFGVPDKDRHSYKVWEEGRVPDFVLEVASESSAEKDLGSKKNTYERMGVREYCVFDPQGHLHTPRLQLFRLERGVYKRVIGRRHPDGRLAVTSETLDLELRFEDDRLRLWDPATQEYLLEYSEERRERLKEQAGRIAAERRAVQADQRADQERQRADQADQRADQARQQAEAESLARRELEAELAALKERLR